MRKKILITLGVLIVITSGLLISVLNMRSKMISYAMPVEEKQSSIAIMIQQDSGSYSKAISVSNSKKYVINRSKSKCEGRGSVVSYNRTNGTIQYRLPSTDMCYVYLDIDKTAPTVSSLTLNSGANYTTSRSVTAVFTYPNPEEDWTHYCLTLDSDGSDCTSGNKWQSLNLSSTSTSTTFTFSADGNQTVYAFIKDWNDNLSSPASDAIIVDTLAPNVPTYSAYFVDGSGTYISGSWTNKAVRTDISSTDATSGLNRIEYRASGSSSYSTLNFAASGGLVNGKGTEDWTLKIRNDTYYFRACDNAGNCSGDSSAYNIRYDYNNAPRFTSNPTISGTNIIFTAVDDYSGVKQACLSSSSSSSGCTWVNANNNSQSTIAVNYSSAGTYYIHVKDGVGYVTSASFTASNYTVTFAGDGGTPSSSSLTAVQGRAITMPTVSAKDCFAGIGWNGAQGQTAVTYSDGGAYALNSNVTLYPVWTNSFLEDLNDGATPCIANFRAETTVGNNYYGWDGTRYRSYPPGSNDWPWVTDTMTVQMWVDIKDKMTHNRTLTVDWGISTDSYLWFNVTVRVIDSNGGVQVLNSCTDCQDEGTRGGAVTLYAGLSYTIHQYFTYPKWYGYSWAWLDNIKVY